MTRAPAGDGSLERSLQVLVVDDNVDAAETLMLLLQTYGHEVTMAHDGSSALDKASESRPDLVLLDIGLPGLDGFEVAKLLREQGFMTTRLVALTGYGRSEDVQQALAAGFDHHLVKPVSLDALRKIIADVQVNGTPA